ncbi:MAG: hypothetical protein Q7T20_03385 [Saprospiraceae bacterium]|nr:hypothetical protein [Saprospiraceae bacterium]
MKKLFLFYLILLFFSIQLSAQKHSISLSTGPGAIYYWTNDIQQNQIKSPIGFSFGVDYARKINAQWQFKLGIRYCLWKVPNLNGPLQWPSEHDGNGGYLYDPSIAHYLIKDFGNQDAFQFLPGFRWQSKQEDFHWIALGEFGFSGFMKNSAGISTQLHPTAGLAFGAEWLLRSNLHVFVQPGGRIVFRDFKRENARESHLLNLNVELGARFSF